MEKDEVFSGFMPLIKSFKVYPLNAMINTDGNLMNAHTIAITTMDNKEFIFSMSTEDLMKLHFLIHKVL